MNRFHVILLLLFISQVLMGQGETRKFGLKYKGQISAYSHYNPSNQQSLWFGGRYLPQLNANIDLEGASLIDFEVSGNLYGNSALADFSNIESDGNIKPYRAWMRFSNEQLEIRAGLQKINFGSAAMLRPLMWFDQIDPRDPLKLTDGVWAVLGRYYFLNNANVWLWGLYGNENLKGWEYNSTTTGKPEFGGRIQYPIPSGEIAFTYHNRTTSVQNPFMSIRSETDVKENRFGFDLRYDWVVGCWFEASITKLNEPVGLFPVNEVYNVGFDYTIGVGSGIYIAFEQLLMSVDDQLFAFDNTVPFSLMSISYPIGLFDNVSSIVYYDWKNNNAYNFVNYQKQFENLSLYVMGYWNPENYNIPLQGGSTNLFGGKGIQLMLVWNH